MSTGTAKPTGSPSASIWELMPITRPRASSSGPPALRGLSVASVWITPAMPKPLGAVIRWPSAETTPVVSVRSRPNGLPIASVGSPTRTPEESPELERPQLDVVGRVDAQEREVRVGVRADDPRRERGLLVERDLELGRLGRRGAPW